MSRVSCRAVLVAAIGTALVGSYALGYLTDSDVHPPPMAGAYAYNTFGPGAPGFPQVGESYVDPVFGSTVRRVSDDYPNDHLGTAPYVKNGYWNADSTRYWAEFEIIDAQTGAVVRAGVGDGDGSFDPVDADTYYYFSGGSLMGYSVSSGSSAAVKTFTGALSGLGGSTDWIDRSGRYFVVRYDGSIKVWDRQDDVVYTSGAPSRNAGAGWYGISPDGSFLIIAADTGWYSYRIDHAGRSFGAETMFWNLCGDHGDLVSASDGNTYVVTYECHSVAAIFRVDVTLDQSAAGPQEQRDSNLQLFDTDWPDSGHISGVSKGALSDWAFVSVTSTDDGFDGDVSNWRAYESEIVMANVLTGEVRRLAHHRSRAGGYCAQPRVSASWDGTRAMFASNFNVDAGGSCGYSDLYVLEVDPGPPDTTPPAAPTGLSVQ
jgi:hypothetical protein